MEAKVGVATANAEMEARNFEFHFTMQAAALATKTEEEFRGLSPKEQIRTQEAMKKAQDSLQSSFNANNEARINISEEEAKLSQYEEDEYLFKFGKIIGSVMCLFGFLGWLGLHQRHQDKIIKSTTAPYYDPHGTTAKAWRAGPTVVVRNRIPFEETEFNELKVLTGGWRHVK